MPQNKNWLKNNIFSSCKCKSKNKFRTFCEETTIHGFAELFRAQQLATKVLWMSMLIISTGMLAYQLYGCINQFSDQRTITSVHPASETDIIYPPFKFCSPHWLFWFSDEKIKFLNKSTILSALSRLSVVFSETPFDQEEEDNILQRYFENRKISLNKTFYGLQDFLIENSRAFLGGFTGYETTEKELLKMPSNLRKSEEINLCYITNSGDMKENLKLASKLTFVGRLQSGNNSFSLTEKEFSYTTLYSDHISQDIAKLSKELSILYEEINGTKKWKGDDLIWAQLEKINSRNKIVIDGYNDIFFVLSPDVSKYSVYLKASIQKRLVNSWALSCEPDKISVYTKETCLQRCKFQSMHFIRPENSVHAFNETDCKYFRTFLELNEKITNMSDVCTSYITMGSKNDTDSLKTLNLNNIGQLETSFGKDNKKYNECMQECNNGCTIIKYEMFVSISDIDKENSYNEVTVFYPNADDVLVFQELESKTWQDFVGIVGGILGVWTGASVLSIIQLISFFCCQYANVTNDRRNRKHSVGRRSTLHA